MQVRPNFTQQNYRNNFPPNNIRPVYKNEQLREKDSKIDNIQFQGQESKTKVNKIAAFATNNDSELEDSYEEDNVEITSVSEENDQEGIKAIEYNIEEVQEIAGLGLIRTKEIIRDVDEVCA